MLSYTRYMTAAEKILQDALALPKSQRSRVALRLVASLEPHLTDDVEATNEATIGVEPPATPRRDLSDIVGTWTEDAAIEDALAQQRHMDPALWT